VLQRLQEQLLDHLHFHDVSFSGIRETRSNLYSR
jgi:hypothetical protein